MDKFMLKVITKRLDSNMPLTDIEAKSIATKLVTSNLSWDAFKLLVIAKRLTNKTLLYSNLSDIQYRTIELRCIKFSELFKND